MNSTIDRAVAIVGVGAILPDAPNAPAYWQNIVNKRYSISEIPAERWDPALYYDADPAAPDKTYSKIGGWVRGYEFDWKKYRIPPRVADAMDPSQKWAVTIAAEALADYGYPDRPLNTERTGVILGTAMGGEYTYMTTLRIKFPEFAQLLTEVSEFAHLPQGVQETILAKWHERFDDWLPQITEDTMPGELPNIVSGRVANVLNLRGPNFITDAACASSFAAINAAVEMLTEHHVDAVIAGGVDRNMGPEVFVKFCKIGALSATGSRPFGDGADGFVMGEGAGAFLLKRLEDAERDGDKIYAVIRGVGGSSDGKGKGITAPNPIGQILAASRAWENAGLDPTSATLIEAHGTSTKVGDVVELESLAKVFGGAAQGSIGLGSAKGNIGHLKAGAGAAGLLKAVLAIHHKILPPTLNSEKPNPNADFANSPFRLIHQAEAWPANGTPRRAGVSAYGFGGTNFHLVIEEHVPGLRERDSLIGVLVDSSASTPQSTNQQINKSTKTPLRGILALGADSPTALKERLDDAFRKAEPGWTPPVAVPDQAELRAAERLVIDFGDHAELMEKLGKARKALGFDNPQAWRALQGQGIFRGSGPKPGKIAFLFPGQGSQYTNMGRQLAALNPGVKQVFDEADAVMTPILGKPLTSYIFVDADDPTAMKKAELDLMQTAITQPAMLTADTALYKLLGEYGFAPDMVMGHSLGEYGALIAAGIMPFAHALEASAARGAEMTKVSMADNGWMAAVMAPIEIIEKTLTQIDGYVVAANINSTHQAVVGGASAAVKEAIDRFTAQGFQAMRIPVSHAFHTKIVAPASGPLRKVLDRLSIRQPHLPLVANVTGNLYPTTVEGIKDILELQIASPVQWVKGLETLYAQGVRMFVEVGPKKALKGFTDDVLGSKPDVWSLFTNHPKTGEIASFNHALCGLYAAGYGVNGEWRMANGGLVADAHVTRDTQQVIVSSEETTMSTPDLTQLLAQALQQMAAAPSPSAIRHSPFDRNDAPAGSIIISGTGLGLPGAEKPVMDPDNAMRILRGEQFVDLIPERFRKGMANKNITRLVKSADGGGSFEIISDTSEVIKLAGRGGSFDLTEEYGVPIKLVEALDTTTQLAMAAGLDALREAGIPLVQTYRTTSKGTFLPDRWLLPPALRDETGVIFASAFPGGDRFADEFSRYYGWQNKVSHLETLEDLRRYTTDPVTLQEITRRIADMKEQMEREPYIFDRRFLFRILAMGHSQFAEYIGARGPNTHVNAACASTAQGVAVAEDWIRSGRCRRVIVIGADNVTSEHLMEWVGSGFLAVGAVATDDRVDEAALPFDRRRHGTILGMGACGLVVESEDAVRERGMRGIVEVLSSETANSAFHGTRLDVEHISLVMDNLVTAAERRFGVNRHSMAGQTVFMSHETFTPARGGSASAEVTALRRTFGEAANDLIMANTKGFTGHPMGVGIEDVIAVKILEYGIVPPVPNFKEIDPELGPLTLSRGGRYPVQYALHLAAGFGSQISMTLVRRIPGNLDRTDNKPQYRRWLADLSGLDHAETEVVKRVLRIVATGTPGREPVSSSWRYGTGPLVRAAAPGDRGSGIGDQGLGVAAMRMPAPSPVSAPAPKPIPAPVPKPMPAPVAQPAPVVPKPAPAPAPAPVTPASAPISQSPNLPIPNPQSPVEAKVLAIVAAKTGYPSDMLDTDLDMEADLGIDTVKQAETFQAVREAFDIPVVEGLSLRDYPTLDAVVGFVHKMRPELGSGDQGLGIGDWGLGVGDRGGVAPIDQSPNQPTTHSPLPNPQSPVEDKIIAIVAAKTGYPSDMLDMDLDMEADLGIDTVKQAETFQAVREAFDIPVVEGLSLRDYPTLGAVVGFVHKMRPELAGAAVTAGGEASSAPAAQPTNQPINQSTTPATIGTLADADRMPRRVPVAVVRPSLDLCKPTGVSLGEGSRVVVMMDTGGVGKALVARLEKRGVTVLVLDGAPTAEALDATLAAWLADGPITGVYWLPALDVEPELEEMDLAQWRELNRLRTKNLFLTMRTLYDVVDKTGTFLISATRLGGLHGYGADGATAPLGGAVVGFTKAFKRERPDVTVKAVDFEISRKTAEPADLLIAETLSDPGVVEIGYNNGGRITVSFEERPAADGQPGMVLNKESVFVVTGAAGGITSAIVTDLAVASQGLFYLLDLVQAPARDDENVRLFRTDVDGLKRKFMDEVKANGERPTPVIIDKMIMGVERSEAALRAMETVEAAGGTAYYHSVDLMDQAAVNAVMDEIRARHGRIDVLLHAGGVIIDAPLPKKEPRIFNLVFDVKADGFFSLLKAATGMPIGATVAFSSVAGRFGNHSQSDYSAANDLLCKVSSSMRRWRPDTRAIAIDWTAWGGIGMAARGSVPQIMAALGVDMLPAEAGVPTIRRELTYGGTRGEIIVAGRLGAMAEEPDADGGLDLAKAQAALEANASRRLMVGKITGSSLYGGITVETILDPATQPFLFDHQVEPGVAWLPGVMGTESMAEFATLLAPGYTVAAVESVQMLGAFKFHRNQPRTLVLSGYASPDGSDLLAHVRVQSVFQAPKPELPAQIKDHFAAVIRLTPAVLGQPTVAFTVPVELPDTAQEIYKVFFHGPAYQVMERAAVDGGHAVALMADNLGPNTAPADAASVMAPRLIELCFQTAAWWSIKTKGVMALPAGYDSVTAFRQPSEAEGRRLYAQVTSIDNGDRYDAQVVDEAGNVYVKLTGYRTVEMPA